MRYLNKIKIAGDRLKKLYELNTETMKLMPEKQRYAVLLEQNND